MCKRNYYICVNDEFPSMELYHTYNSGVLPKMNGTQVFTFENIFEDLSPNDTAYIEVSVPSDAKVIEENGNIWLDRYTFVDRTKLTTSVIEWLITSGVNPEVGFGGMALIYWAIENDSVGTLMYLLDILPDTMPKRMYDFINTFVTDKRYNGIIVRLVNAGYDIHRDNDSLFLFVASNKKNPGLCRFLLEHGSYIPIQVVNMFKVNHGRYPEMDTLIEEYAHRIK